MSKPSQKKREKQRKKKARDLARARERQQLFVQPYEGNRYKTEAYVPAVFAAERGIYEAFVVSRRTLTDADVRDALESMVRDLRQATVRPLPEEGEEVAAEDIPSLVEWMIRQRWQEHAKQGGRLSREEQVGILRTMLNSVNVFGSGRGDSRGYLTFVEGTMDRLGVEVTLCDEQGRPLDEDEQADDPEMDELLDLADDWLTGDLQARQPFFDLARHLMRQGRGLEVGEAVRRIAGQYDAGVELPLLVSLALEADGYPRGPQ